MARSLSVLLTPTAPSQTLKLRLRPQIAWTCEVPGQHARDLLCQARAHRETDRSIRGGSRGDRIRRSVGRRPRFTDFKDFTELAQAAYQAQALETMLGQIIAWSQALAPLRQLTQAA